MCVLACDLPQLDAARALAQKVKAHIGGLKLGLEFFCAHGHHGVHELAHVGLPIFLDLKLHDIPNTVAKAVESLSTLPIGMLTLHTAGGTEMMAAARTAQQAANPDLLLLGPESLLQRQPAAPLYFLSPEVASRGEPALPGSLDPREGRAGHSPCAGRSEAKAGQPVDQ